MVNSVTISLDTRRAVSDIQSPRYNPAGLMRSEKHNLHNYLLQPMGPRKDQPADYELCKKTRAIILQVDWDCKVFTRFQEENLGCKIGVSSAIDWFFHMCQYHS